MFPDNASCRRKYSLVTGGNDGLRILQFLVAPHAVVRSWNQLVLYRVVRRTAVHNNREAVAVGVKNPFDVAFHKSSRANPLWISKEFSSSLTGGELAFSRTEATM